MFEMIIVVPTNRLFIDADTKVHTKVSAQQLDQIE